MYLSFEGLEESSSAAAAEVVDSLEYLLCFLLCHFPRRVPKLDVEKLEEKSFLKYPVYNVLPIVATIIVVLICAGCEYKNLKCVGVNELFNVSICTNLSSFWY